MPDDTFDPNRLVACPRCQELVVTVEMRTTASVFWRCVHCGHIFAQRLKPREEPPPEPSV